MMYLFLAVGVSLAVVLGSLYLAVLLRRKGRPDRTGPAPSRPEGDAGLEPVIEQALKEIEALVRGRAAIALVAWIGAVDISPIHLAFWIFTQIDEERDRLAADPALQAQLREVLRGAGYPAAAVPRVSFAFESKETVDQHFDGNYWYAMK